MTTLSVTEAGTRLDFSVDDIMKYHGPGFPGGVAHGIKAMELAFALLSPEGPPERRDIRIRTAFRGPGARDAFEIVTRSLTDGRYLVDGALERPERGDILFRYVFEVHYGTRSVCVQLRDDGLVREEFIRLGQKPDRTEAENMRLAWLKQEMAERLLALPAERVYERRQG